MKDQGVPLLSQISPGVLHFGGARMALLEIESGFWGIRRQIEALIGTHLTNSVLQQAGVNGGASFARSFFSEKPTNPPVGFQACLLAYQAAGFGRFEIKTMEWPLGRLVIQAHDAFEAWMMLQNSQKSGGAVCAYTAGVLVGFINVISGRKDVVCFERQCQVQGADACEFELLPASKTSSQQQIVAFNPDPGMSRQINLLEMLFDRMPMGIAVIDRDCILRRCNPTWEAFISRYTPSQGIPVAPGTNIFDLEPGTEEVILPLFNQVFAGETVRQEAVRTESGGITSYRDFVLSPLYENDQVIGLLNVSIDATERVLAEQRLKETLDRLAESESRLRSVIENAQHFVIYRVEIDQSTPFHGKAVLVSPFIRELTGIEDPYCFESWFENLHPEDYPRIVDANRRSVEEGIVYNQLARVFNVKEDRWRWVQTISNPGFDAEGRLTHFDGMIIDLTDQKEAELALQQTLATLEERVAERTQELKLAIESLQTEIEQRKRIEESLRISQALYTEVFDHSPLMLFVQEVLPDGHFKILRTNPAHQRESGLPPDKIWGKTIEEIVIPEVTQAINQHYRDCIQAGNPIEYEEQGPSPYWNLERIRTFRTTLAPVFDNHGDVVRLVGASEDITDQKQAEMIIMERTREEAASVERGRLARDLHDAVTQTLFSASLIADALPKLWERNPETGRQKLGELRQLMRGALSEMRTLLLELHPDTLVEVDLGDLYQHLTNAFTGRTRIPVASTQEGQSPLPQDVKEVFYRVAQEALNNTAKHAGASQVQVHLIVGEGAAEVSIQDDGCGFDIVAMTPEHMGLKIMRERANAVHAKLNIDSAPGAGTLIQLRWQAGEVNS